LVGVTPFVAGAGLGVALISPLAGAGDFVEEFLAAASAVGSDAGAEDAFTPRHGGVWQGFLTVHGIDSRVIRVKGFRRGVGLGYSSRARSE